MNKLLALLLLASLILNALLLNKNSKIGAHLRPKTDISAASLPANKTNTNTEEQDASGPKHLSTANEVNVKGNTSDSIIELEKLFANKEYFELELRLREYLNLNPTEQRALMLEAKLIMQTQTLNYALTHYYELLGQSLSNEYQNTIHQIIQEQTTKVIQQLTGDGAWEILATFLEPLLQVDPINPQYVLALARAYGMQEQETLMENVLAALPFDHPRAMRLREQVSIRLARRNNVDTQEIITSEDSFEDLSQTKPSAVAKLSSNNQLLTRLQLSDKTVSMLLDTGASTTAIRESVINDLDDKDKDFVGYFNVQTAGGGIRAPLYRISNVTLGSSKFEDVSVIALPDGAMRRFDGLLGMNILKAFEMNFDQSQQKMLLTKKH